MRDHHSVLVLSSGEIPVSGFKVVHAVVISGRTYIFSPGARLIVERLARVSLYRGPSIKQ